MTSKQHRSLIDFLMRVVVAPVMRQRFVLVSIFLALLFLSLSQAAFLVLIKGFLAAFFADVTTDAIALSAVIPQRFIAFIGTDFDLVMRRRSVVVYVPIGIVFAGFLKAFASYIYNVGVARLALKVGQHYRETVFQAIVSLPWLRSSQRSPGEWMSVIMADAVFIQTRLSDFSTAFIKDSVLIISCLVTLAFIHWPAALILLLISPLIAWQMGKAGKRISWFTEAFQRELGLLSGLLLAIRERFRFMRAQQGESFESSYFEARNKSYLDMMSGSIFIRAIVAPGMELVGFFIFSAFLYAWTRQVSGFSVEPDVAIQFFVALGLILKPVREIGEQVARWSETMGGLRRSMMILEEVAREGSLKRQGQNRFEPVHSLVEKSIRIDSITVNYGARQAFQGEHLQLSRGKSVAIIGPSGAGKSTLLKCLSGLVTPTVWHASTPWDQVRSKAALVSQQPFLFKDSIRCNLTYGLSEERLSAINDGDIMAVLAIVNLQDWMVCGEGSLNTEFNPVQSNLSGGQIQRLVIARALLRSPEILLLDESTSAVDAGSEQDITQRLIAMNKQKGSFLLAVTHRLRWLSLYDEVWFVEDGQILMRGSHQQLQTNGRYRMFCSEAGL